MVPGGDLSGTLANAQVLEASLDPGGDLSGTLANAQVSEAGLTTGGDVSGPVSNVQIGPGVVGDAEAGNVIRSILIPAAELNPPLPPASNTAPAVVAVSGIAATLSYDDSAADAVLATTRVPGDREAGTPVDLVLHWSAVNGSGGTGSVVFRGDFVSAAEGEASLGGSTALDFGIVNAPMTANTLETSTETILGSSIANGDLFHFSVLRAGSLGSDDQVGDARLHLIEFRYTAVR